MTGLGPYSTCLQTGAAVAELGTFPATELLLLTGSQWRVLQRLPAFGATGLDLTAAEGRPHLLVSNRYSGQSRVLGGRGLGSRVLRYRGLGSRVLRGR